MSRFPDIKSICAKYGLSVEDPIRKRKRAKKILTKIKSHKYSQFGKTPKRFHKKRYSKKAPNTHYYIPDDIKLKTFKSQQRQNITCWICGQERHLANKFPQGDASKKTRGKDSQVKARRNTEREMSSKVPIHCNHFSSDMHITDACP